MAKSEFKFEKEQCLVCGEKFGEGDDVVVCPECGTPHHRACYAEAGECANFERHGDGFEWKSRVSDIISVLQEREKRDIVLLEKEKEEREKKKLEDFKKRSIFGASKEELSIFMSVEPEFLEYKTQNGGFNPLGLNLLAGLLAPVYQFYKGMRLFGILLLIPSVLILAPDLFMQFNITRPFEFIMSLFGSEEAALTAINVFRWAELAFLILFHDYIYMRFCAGKIKKIRALYPEEGEEYREALRVFGRPGVLRAVVDMFASTAFLILAMFIVASAFLNA